jgi:hypothetical protein
MVGDLRSVVMFDLAGDMKKNVRSISWDDDCRRARCFIAVRGRDSTRQLSVAVKSSDLTLIRAQS